MNEEREMKKHSKKGESVMFRGYSTFAAVAIAACAVFVFAGAALGQNPKLFVFAGQSNMVGVNTNRNTLTTQERQSLSNVKVFIADPGHAPSQPMSNLMYWLPPNGTLTNYTPWGINPTDAWNAVNPGEWNRVTDSYGPEFTTARDLANSLGETIYIVKYAVGATYLYLTTPTWNVAASDIPGNPVEYRLSLYHTMRAWAQAALAYVRQVNPNAQISGVFWMQGESDSMTTTTANAYQTNLTTFIQQVRSDFGIPGLPFIFGKVPPAPAIPTATRNIVVNGQANVDAADPNAAMVNTDDLPINTTDNVHFTDAGHKTLGQRFAQAWLTMTDTVPPSAPTNVTATAQSATSILVAWTASTDNLGVTGYKIYRNGAHVGTTASTSHGDSGLSPNTTYSYTVYAYDGAGNNSAQSSPPATATTQQHSIQGQWLWEADNHSGSSGSYSSNWTDGVHVFSENKTSGGWYWNWDDPAASNARLIGPGTASGRSWLQSSSFGEDWSVDVGITIAARVKPVAVSGWGDIMLSVNNSSTLDLASAEEPTAKSTHVWVGWDAGEQVVFVTRNNTVVKQFTSSVPFTNVWTIWTLGAKQIGSTIAWDLWINGVWQEKTAQATDGSYHTLVWSKGTDMGTSVVIGQRRSQPFAHDTIWDYVGVTKNGVVPGWDGLTATGDIQSPSVPSSVTATAQSSTSVLVNWTTSTDNVGVTGYKVYRNASQVGTSATTSYTDTGLTVNTTYSYTVSAYDAASNNSAQSSPAVTAKTPDQTAPSAPSGVSATAQTPRQVKVTWTASTDNVGVTGYKVYRNGSQVGTSTTTSYTDTGLQQNTTYSYTVSAYDAAANNSAPSSPTVTIMTLAAIDIDEAKELTNLQLVGMVSKTVTAIYSGCFYVEETDRYAGIKVVPIEMPGGLVVGSVVDVGGIVQTINEERYIGSATVTVQ